MISVIPSSEAFSTSLVESLADQVNEKLEMNPKLDWFLENEKSTSQQGNKEYIQNILSICFISEYSLL